MSAPVIKLADDQLERLAKLIAAELASSQPAHQLLSADQLAARLGVSVRYVRDHATELGAIRLGTGSKKRLRFDPQHATEASEPVQTTAKPRRRTSSRVVAAGSVLTVRART